MSTERREGGFIEDLLDRWVDYTLRHRPLVILGVLLVTATLGWSASRLPFMTAYRDYVPPDTVGMDAWEAARARFGGDEVVLLSLEADDHFTASGLARLDRITRRLAEQPMVERVTSLTNAQQVWTDSEDPDAGLFVETYLRQGVTPEALKAGVLDDPLLADWLVSRDARTVVIAVQYVATRDDVAARQEIRREVDRRTASLPGIDIQRDQAGGRARLLDLSKQMASLELVDLVAAEGFPPERIHAIGFLHTVASVYDEMVLNLQVILPLVVGMTALVLFLLLRRFVDVALVFVCLLPAVVWAVGLGGLLFGRITILTSLAPAMVHVVGISDVVHLVTQFRQELTRGAAKEQAIRLAFRHVGAACLFTSFTTLVGFGSMAFLPMAMLRELGVFAAFGVATAFVLAFLICPVALSHLRPEAIVPRPSRATEHLFAVLRRVARGLRPRARAMMLMGVVATVVATGAVSQLEVDTSLVRNFAPGHPVRGGAATLERAFGSSVEFEILIDANGPDGLKEPQTVTKLIQLQEDMEADPRIGKTMSIADLVTRLHSVISPDAFAERPVPESKGQIAQYLLLYELSGGRDLHSLVDPSFQHARMVVRAVETSAEHAVELANDIETMARNVMPGNVSVRANGMPVLLGRLSSRIRSASLLGFGVAMLLMGALVALLFRSIRVGLLSLVPNVLPVALGVGGVVVFCGQADSDVFSFMAIGIGLAVDDTIHFLARYRIERVAGRDRPAAVEATMLGAGHGIIRTSVVLIAGFLPYLISNYQTTITLGIMLPVTVASALVLDLTLVPAMAQLGLLEPKRLK